MSRGAAAWLLVVMIAPCAPAAETPDAVLPALVAPALHRYGTVVLAPDGAHIASIEGDTPPYVSAPPIRELVIRRVSDGQRSEVRLPCARQPECWPGSPVWTSDGRELVFTLRTPGTHRRSLYMVGAQGGTPRRLLSFDGTLEQLRFGPGGELAVLATAGARKETGATQAGAPLVGEVGEKSPEQRIAVLEHGSLRFVSPPDLYVYDYDWQARGRGFVGTAAHGDGDNQWWVAQLYAFATDGSARVIYRPTNVRQQLAAPRVSPDGRRVAFIAGLMSDFGSTGGDVYTLSVEGGAPQVVLSDAHASATALDWGCQGQLLVTVLQGASTRLLDLGDGTQPRAPQSLWSGEAVLTSGQENHDSPFSLACPGQLSATVRESFTAPPEIYVGPIGQWHARTALNAGRTLAADVRSLEWRSDGFSVQGWLLLPHRAGSLPLITIVHGGPAAASMPQFARPAIAADLLQQGYAVFLPNPRGSFGQGERFTLANVRDFGYGDLRDILAGIDAAARAAPIDRARLGITGFSYGGYMTMWAVTQTRRFAAAVAGAGVSDWLSYYGENGIDEWMIPYFGASVYEDPQIYARSAPITYIRNVKTPTFVYVGERDIECPPPQSEEFWHALRALGVPTALLIYPGEGHGMRVPADAVDAARRTLAWFARYLR